MRRISILLALVICTSAAAAREAATDMRRLLLEASSWTYQLQHAHQIDLSRTAYDIIVIDAFFGGGQKQVAELRNKPLGGRRIVLSYLSIGEAETYRYYWNKCCSGRSRPPWVLTENARWKGNFRVQFWHPDWKAIVYGAADSYLKRIIDAGFDGVYLDRIDVHSEVRSAGVNTRRQMIGFVRALSAKARSLKPDFLIIAQNAEELLDDAGYLEAIDGIAKEDLLYGVDGDGKRNASEMARDSISQLKLASDAGKQVMVVEYLKDPRAIAAARTEVQELGFVPYFAPRNLERLQVENLEDDDSH
ncbi:MAG: MJ1477/TM1410 family putative glycoside hydrolase [Hyphomicrobiaceae bacterium]